MLVSFKDHGWRSKDSCVLSLQRDVFYPGYFILALKCRNATGIFMVRPYAPIHFRKFISYYALLSISGNLKCLEPRGQHTNYSKK